MTTSDRYLGMREGDLAGKAYAKHWQPRMASLSANAREAVAVGPIAAPLLPPLESARLLLEPGDQETEDGFTIAPSGALHVAIRTAMPDVSPAMVDWWFGWHSAEPQRYKLWHPRAHVHAAWRGEDAPRAIGRDRYVGRTSIVDEYVGGDLGRYAIRFVRPGELGLDESRLTDDREATAVCARVGFAEVPLDFGWLVHHVRRVPGGAEMRSRFWVGGPHAAARDSRVLGAIVPLVRNAKRPRPDNGRDLLVHCAQEMAHLASFLPRLHAELREVP
jgi:hypothetical protein